jgi:hypothetical protein
LPFPIWLSEVQDAADAACPHFGAGKEVSTMFGVNWSDPQTLWLNLTNLALGVVTLAAVLVLVCGVGRELVLRRRKANALDAEMRAMLRDEPGHIMSVPGLGLTMADGGEALGPVQPPRAAGDRRRK